MIASAFKCKFTDENKYICFILTFDPAKNAIQSDAPEGGDTF